MVKHAQRTVRQVEGTAQGEPGTQGEPAASGPGYRSSPSGKELTEESRVFDVSLELVTEDGHTVEIAPSFQFESSEPPVLSASPDIRAPPTIFCLPLTVYPCVIAITLVPFLRHPMTVNGVLAGFPVV